MATTLLDASALLAALNEEPGSNQVEACLDDAAISTVNVAEVVGKLYDANWSGDQITETLNTLRLDVIPFEFDAALIAGQLRRATLNLGLSLADRACLATASLYKYPILTADRVWAKLRVRGIKIQVIR